MNLVKDDAIVSWAATILYEGMKAQKILFFLEGDFCGFKEKMDIDVLQLAEIYVAKTGNAVSMNFLTIEERIFQELKKRHNE